ncbi:MAG: DUF6383 domain-containing protein [Bacteroidales bacterium]|nr:DUF6383 domain-containing protein [Bacteroidales bacterium]
MDIKKIFMTGLFFAMALVGYGQNEGYVIDETGVCTISTAQGLLNFNDGYEDILNSKTSLSEIVFDEGKEYDLREQNWVSKIDLKCSVKGNNATIIFCSSTYIDGEDHATGLFRSIKGAVTIESLTIKAEIVDNINGQDNVYLGALANTIEASSSFTEQVKIESVVVGSVTQGISVEGTSHYYIGGLIGYISSSDVDISKCESEIGINMDATAYFGGIVGVANSSVSIDMCKCNGVGSFNTKVNSRFLTVYGGIVGMSISKLYITECYNSSKIEGTPNSSLYMGGIVGTFRAENRCRISACVFAGELKAIKPSKFNYISIGGLVAEVEAGRNSLIDISHCYVVGSLSIDDSYKELETRDSYVYSAALVGDVYYRHETAKCSVSNSFAYFSEQESDFFNGKMPQKHIEGGVSDSGYNDLFTNVECYYKGENDTRFMSGEIAYNLNKGSVDDRHVYFVQIIGTDPYPKLYFESEDFENEVVYKECKKEGGSSISYTNDNSHNFDNPFGVCSVCHEVDPLSAGNETLDVEVVDGNVDFCDVMAAYSENNVAKRINLYTDIAYSAEKLLGLEIKDLENLSAKPSFGTSEKPFVASIVNEREYGIVNLVAKTNSIIGQLGNEETSEALKKIVIEGKDRESAEEMMSLNKIPFIAGLSVVNSVLYDDLSESEEDENGGDNTYLAAFANVNHGVISYCSFVGTLAAGSDEDVVPCFVGANYGIVENSFMYLRSLEDVKASSAEADNKAAIIVKGNTGVGKKAGGKVKKVAVNQTQTNKLSALARDAYFTPDDEVLNQNERVFTDEEFASGVVAYWLNYEDKGYTGTYSCRYTQGELYPVLQEASEAEYDGGRSVHMIVYDVPQGVTMVGGKAFANGEDEFTVKFSTPVEGVTLSAGAENYGTCVTLSADKQSATISVPRTKQPNITLTATGKATDIERVSLDAETKVVVDNGKLRVFGALGEVLAVYGLDGAMVYKETVNADVVEIPVLPRGMYFVKVGGVAKKISL